MSDAYYEGPSRRYYIALKELGNNDSQGSEDPWVQRLVDIIRLRKRYMSVEGGSDKFAREWPMFHLLLSTYESNGIGSNRDVIEAAIIASPSSKEIADTLSKDGFTESFIDLYKKFFYDLADIRNNDVKFAQYILLPILRGNTDKLAVGAIWKLLACSGGLKMLVDKGFKSTAIRPEDISYLLQLTCMRNCSMLLQYAAEGRAMLAEQPGVQSFMTTLSDFDGVRGSDRRPDGFAVTTGMNRNIYNSMLSAGIKLISAPDEISSELLLADGTFHPELEGAQEYSKHAELEG